MHFARLSPRGLSSQQTMISDHTARSATHYCYMLSISQLHKIYQKAFRINEIIEYFVEKD